ncbi:MAG: 2Fe-2S iron-sulfur cluster binding domain-containing protein, partial [Deltaproteobacteria bacterium]|nr:2Fe-2S iron-sulfur cluster binding domain-containing protein [Deltaproteobacteria bacterium]
MKKTSISFILNGDNVTAEVPATWTLLKTLREIFELTGAKEGCGVGECGACTVI